MSLVTLTDVQQGMYREPARLTKIEEDENYNLTCEAEPYVYGVSAPSSGQALATPPSPGGTPIFGTRLPNVNTPIIFQPVTGLTDGSSQLWLVVSNSDPQYGGCAVYVSTDGGASYEQILGTINGNAPTGVTTSDWPAAADPDTTNDLNVNLAESLGVLESYTDADEDNFLYPCYVEGGVTAVPYELMTYGTAYLVGGDQYNLQAMEAGKHLRRAVYAAPQVGEGVDHPMGSRFAFLNPSGAGILKVPIDPIWIGKTLYFKFAAFNAIGGGAQNPADVTPYSYTVLEPSTGGSPSQGGQWSNYSISPNPCLSQPVSTFDVVMAQVTGQFPGVVVNYNGRTFTVADPGPGNTQVYYVTVADPNLTGDTGAGTTLTAYCETTDEKVGMPGFAFMGSINVSHAGGSVVVTPGGWQGVVFVVGIHANRNRARHKQRSLDRINQFLRPLQFQNAAAMPPTRFLFPRRQRPPRIRKQRPARLCPPMAAIPHARRDRSVGLRVHQDERARAANLAIRIQRNRPQQIQSHHANVVHVQRAPARDRVCQGRCGA